MTDFDQLEEALARYPRVSLINDPTPVRRLSGAFPQFDVWLKDDSSTHPVYGGNKPRKLEFLLACALKDGRDVITYGAETSNHALATAYHCKQLGLDCHLVLTAGPYLKAQADDEQSEGREKLLEKMRGLMGRFATSVTVVEDYRGGFRAGAAKWLELRRRGRRPMIIPPGGTNAMGSLGYVRAGLELARQIERGELPTPESVFLPLGTGGTAAGLALGLAACGVPSKVVAVKVVPGRINELTRLRVLASGVARLLPSIPTQAFSLSNLVIEREQLGTGYGQPTEQANHAVKKWFERDGVRLETTYSGKAAAALEARTEQIKASQPWRADGESLLFWLTYSEYRAQQD